jgi:hypothetical protein
LQRELFRLFSPIALTSYEPTEITSKENSPLNSRAPTQRSFSSTSQCATWFKEVNPSSSQINTGSSVSIPQSSCQTESNPFREKALIDDRIPRALPEANQTFVTASTTQTDANPPNPTVGIGTYARTVKKAATEKSSVLTKQYHQILGLRPKYLRYNLWSTSSTTTPTIADWSETALPLPRPPVHELNNPIAFQTISNNPSLFKIITAVPLEKYSSIYFLGRRLVLAPPTSLVAKYSHSLKSVPSLVEFKAEIYASSMNGNHRTSGAWASTLSRPQRLDRIDS